MSKIELFEGKPGQLRGYYTIKRDKLGRFVKGTHVPVVQRYELFGHTNEKTQGHTSVRHEFDATIDTNLSEDQIETDLRPRVEEVFKKEAGRSGSTFGRWHFKGYDATTKSKRHPKGKPMFGYTKNEFYFNSEPIGVAKRVSKTVKYSVDILNLKPELRNKTYNTYKGVLF